MRHSDSTKTQINPVKDFQTNDNFDITGSTLLNISGETGYPTGTVFTLVIIQTDKYRRFVDTNVTVVKNSSESNSFFFTYDMKGNPPGHYYVTLSKEWSNFGIVNFNITSPTPYYMWVKTDPVGNITNGKGTTISGTTDMPVDSLVLIESGMREHTCPFYGPPQTPNPHSYCSGGCANNFARQTTKVIRGVGGVNTWKTRINITTSEWCLNEHYFISVSAANLTNVTDTQQEFHLSV